MRLNADRPQQNGVLLFDDGCPVWPFEYANIAPVTQTGGSEFSPGSVSGILDVATDCGDWCINCRFAALAAVLAQFGKATARLQ